MTQIQPRLLQQGDTVAIVSTARKISHEEIQPAIDLLKSWGLIPKIGKTIGKEYHQFSGTDIDRAEDFQDMLDDETVQAIWCARGGYGTVRIIDLLNFEQFKLHPKWIIGYSDVTALHLHVHNFGIRSIHATMPINISSNSTEAITSLKEVLFNGTYTLSFEGRKQNRQGNTNTQGIIIGGNLSIIYSMLGSNTSVDTTNKILFIEDLDEYLYHIDRMLMNMKRNGYFEKLRALVVGGMTDMHDNSIPFGKNVEAIILDILSEYDFPIYFNYPAGHIKNNTAIIFGSQGTINSSKNMVSLSF